MHKRIVIGLLLPSSTITPMSKDFERGIKKGLEQITTGNEWDVEFVPEFIGQGSKEKIEAAINKLIGYDNADIITGIVSNKSGIEVAEKFEKSKKPFLINNLGEHVPNPGRYNANIFLNSVNLWQQVWSLGYWGVSTYGLNGMFVSGLYDAGYSFSSMLQAGMHRANPESKMSFAIATINNPGELADVASVFQHIEQFNPDFVMAAFCGTEAGIFLKEYMKRGLHKTKPLLGLPFLLQPFEGNDSLEIFTTVATLFPLKVDSIDSFGEMAANPFPQLGYESGQLIAQALNKQGYSSLRERLATSTVQSERGPLAVNVQDTGSNTFVYLVKNTAHGNTEKLQRTVQQELVTAHIDSEEIVSVSNAFSSGWFNPYLGV